MNRRRPVLVAGLGLVAVVLALALVLPAVVTRRPPAVTPRAAPATASEGALRVLRDWDARRADAYAAGSADLLRGLYVPGAGSADLRLLRDYRARGLHVVGMRTQLLSVAVLERRPGRWTVRVTERLEGAVAMHGRRRMLLPRDAASARTLTLVRSGAGRWRVAATG